MPKKVGKKWRKKALFNLPKKSHFSADSEYVSDTNPILGTTSWSVTIISLVLFDITWNISNIGFWSRGRSFHKKSWWNMENILRKFREIDSFHLTSFLAWTFLNIRGPLCGALYIYQGYWRDTLIFTSREAKKIVKYRNGNSISRFFLIFLLLLYLN